MKKHNQTAQKTIAPAIFKMQITWTCPEGSRRREKVSSGHREIGDSLLMNGRQLSMNRLAEQTPTMLKGWYLLQEASRAKAYFPRLEQTPRLAFTSIQITS